MKQFSTGCHKGASSYAIDTDIEKFEFESKILIVLVFLITLALSRLLSREVMLGENIREISLDGT